MLVAVNAEGEPFDARTLTRARGGRWTLSPEGRTISVAAAVLRRTARLIGAWSKRTRKMAEKNAGVRRIRPDARAVLRF